MTEWDLHPWKLDKLRTMRETGAEFSDIAEELGMSQNACKMKCCIEGIYKSVKSKARPNNKSKAGYRYCINRFCRKWFYSTHTVNNQICPRCKGLNEYAREFGF